MNNKPFILQNLQWAKQTIISLVQNFAQSWTSACSFYSSKIASPFSSARHSFWRLFLLPQTACGLNCEKGTDPQHTYHYAHAWIKRQSNRFYLICIGKSTNILSNLKRKPRYSNEHFRCQSMFIEIPITKLGSSPSKSRTITMRRIFYKTQPSWSGRLFFIWQGG